MQQPVPWLDREGLETLFSRLERPIYNLAYRWTWDVQDSREVVQDTFVRLWGMRDRVRMETVEPLTWRIAVNCASRRRRVRRTWSWVPFLEARDAPVTDPAEASLLGRERAAEVRAAVDALPEKLKAVMMLCAYSEMSYEQVAVALEIPPGTVASRRSQALALLRARLGGEVPP